jgi:hypothetical protein
MILDWLIAEEALLVPHAPGGGSGGVGCVGDDASPAAGRGEDAPARAPLGPPPFGTLSPHSGIALPAVRACFVRLSALFSSRVKTLPQSVLRRYQLAAKRCDEADGI